MRRLPRFHLASLLVGSLTAAVLLGLNLTPILADHQGAPPSNSCWGPGTRTIDLPETQRHSAFVRVTQGWPLAIREETAVVRVGTPIPTESNMGEYNASLTRWTWSTNASVDWKRVALNAVALLSATVTILIAVEWMLRRRVSRLKTGP